MKVLIEADNGQKREIAGTAAWGGVMQEDGASLFLNGEGKTENLVIAMAEGVLTFVKEICDHDPDETAELLSLIEECWEEDIEQKGKSKWGWKEVLELYTNDVIKKYPTDGKEWAFGAINFLNCMGKVTEEEAGKIYEQFNIL